MIRLSRSWLSTHRGRRWVRYLAVSLISVASGQVVLVLAFGVVGLSARPANLVAFVAGAVPSYCLNRRWTWGLSGRSHLVGELFPFWALAVAGLAFSTWAVGAAENIAASITDMRSLHTVMVMAASLAAYGALWMVKFLALDRVVFAQSHAIRRGAERSS